MGAAFRATLAMAIDEVRGRDVEHVLGVYVADLVRDDGEHFFVVESFDELRVEDDDGRSTPPVKALTMGFCWTNSSGMSTPSVVQATCSL
jgi:hypothetical protein